MKAMVLESPNQLVYTDVPEQQPVGDCLVLVRIAAVGVCGSDLLRFAAGTAYHYPLILGHEFSAVVEEAPATSRFQASDRVAVFPLLPDLADQFTRIGEYQVSSGYDYFGSRRDGAFAERLYVPESNLIPVPDGVPLLHAAMTEPAAVALHGVLKLKIPTHSTALVIGGGSIGALAALWLRILGCHRVIIADVDQRKLDILRDELGFEVINGLEQDTVKAISHLTNGRGVDIAIEAAGLPITLAQVVEATAVFGQIVLLGYHHKDAVLTPSHMSHILRREITLYGTWNSKITPIGHSEWEMCLHYMRDQLNVAPLISHTPSLSDGPQIFTDMAAHRIWTNKVVFAISEEARSEKEKT